MRIIRYESLTRARMRILCNKLSSLCLGPMRQSIEMAEAELPKDKGLLVLLKKNLKNATDKIR